MAANLYLYFRLSGHVSGADSRRLSPGRSPSHLEEAGHDTLRQHMLLSLKLLFLLPLLARLNEAAQRAACNPAGQGSSSS